MRSALLFPGQGAPAADWHEASRRYCPDLMQQAWQMLGEQDPFDRFGEGTEFDQPAIYLASLAAYEVAGRPDADFHAGHSLGEIAALACAGAIEVHDGLRLVVERGRLMAEAAAKSGRGAMLAVGAPARELEAALEHGDVSIANLNSPSQTVLSGRERAIEAVAAELRERRIRVKRLAVSGAFHTQAMAPAALRFRRTLEGIEIREPDVQVISSRSARPFTDIAAELASGLLDPVRWIDVVAELEREGVSRFIELGPGKALSRLVRACAGGDVEAESIGVPEPTGA